MAAGSRCCKSKAVAALQSKGTFSQGMQSTAVQLRIE
jgi:hypothetical protein